jgi:hypothetical protein
MRKIKTRLFGLFVFFIACNNSIQPESNKMYCGYELSVQEYTILINKIKLQPSAYESDSLWHIYDQVNDSIRSAMPDTVEFEIFLSLLNNNEVAIDVFAPKNNDYFERICCAFMNGKYTGKIPEQRYLSLYSYSNDPSGSSPLELAIKKNK